MVQELVNSGDLTHATGQAPPAEEYYHPRVGRGIWHRDRLLRDRKFSGDDLLLLCTDGLTNYVEEEQI